MGLTVERLKQRLHYNPESGAFTWASKQRRVKQGAVAGGVSVYGYIVIGLDSVLYQASRLAFLYMTGEWPAEYVDHIDGDPKNNRWDNLRAATPLQNQANMKRPKHNTSGFKGVYFCKQAGMWRARIRSAGKTKHLGLFQTPEVAHAAYVEAAQIINGEFARAA
jgi:hypothetical protein